MHGRLYSPLQARQDLPLKRWKLAPSEPEFEGSPTLIVGEPSNFGETGCGLVRDRRVVAVQIPFDAILFDNDGVLVDSQKLVGVGSQQRTATGAGKVMGCRSCRSWRTCLTFLSNLGSFC